MDGDERRIIDRRLEAFKQPTTECLRHNFCIFFRYVAAVMKGQSPRRNVPHATHGSFAWSRWRATSVWYESRFKILPWVSVRSFPQRSRCGSITQQISYRANSQDFLWTAKAWQLRIPARIKSHLFFDPPNQSIVHCCQFIPDALRRWAFSPVTFIALLG